MAESELINKYIEFINFVNEISNLNITIEENSVNEKISNFNLQVKENKKFKKYLLEKREKLFYADNIKLFDNINARKILEKLDSENKNKFWNYLQLFYVLSDKDNDGYTLKLINSIESNLNDNKNSGTKCDSLVNDIFENIQDIFDNNDDDESNPIEKMLNISKQIAEKYKDDVKAGNITLEEMIKCVTKFIQNNDSVNNDMFKNFDLSKDNLNEILGNILENDQLKSLLNNTDLGNVDGNFVNNLMGNLLKNNLGISGDNNAIEDKPLEDNQLEKMEEYFKNISTDDQNIENITLEDDDLNINDNQNLNNLTNMLFSQINNFKSNLDEPLDQDVNLDSLNKLKDELMSSLTPEQKSEFENLKNNIFKGFNIKEQ